MGVGDPAKHKAVASPRPGHADLAGSLKYDFPDARYVLERASAREIDGTRSGGAVAKILLLDLGIEVASHVIRVGAAELEGRTWEEIAALRAKDEVLLNCVDAEAEQRMKAEVDSRCGRATPSAASLKWWCMALRRGLAHARTGMSGWMGCWRRR